MSLAHDVDSPTGAFAIRAPVSQRFSRAWRGYVWGTAVTVLASALAFLVHASFELGEAMMIYLVGVVFISTRFGLAASLYTALLSVLAVDFVLVPPVLSFAIFDLKHAASFGMMFFVALVISSLTDRIRAHADASREREQRTAALYSMGQRLAAARKKQEIGDIALSHVHEVFAAGVALLLAGGAGELEDAVTRGQAWSIDGVDASAARKVLVQGVLAGRGTDHFADARAIYVPLPTSRGTIGVLGVLPTEASRFHDPEQRSLLATFGSLLASALERARLAEEAERAQLEVEAERLQSSLLSSVSHDLRTPLAAITGAASALLDEEVTLDRVTRIDLTETILEEAVRLNRLVTNLLAMTRLESGGVKVMKEWQPIEEVIGAVLTRFEEQLTDRPVTTHVPADLPLVPLDSVLIEQVLINLLDNALKYTPKGTGIDVAAEVEEEGLAVTVGDRGPGVAAGNEERIFEKFFRASPAGPENSFGLGLAICRGMVLAHGGRIWVEKRAGGGSAFRFLLPLGGKAPPLEPGPPSG